MVLQWKERWNCKLLTPLNNLLLQSRNSYSVWHLQLSYEIFKIRHFEMFRWIIHLLITQLPIQSASYTILMKLFKKRCFEKIPWIIPLFMVEFSIKPDSYMYTSLWGKKKEQRVWDDPWNCSLAHSRTPYSVWFIHYFRKII